MLLYPLQGCCGFLLSILYEGSNLGFDRYNPYEYGTAGAV